MIDKKVWVLRIVVIGVFLAIWEYMVDSGYLNKSFFASPTEIAAAVHSIWPEFVPALRVTFLSYGEALLTAIAVGLLIGLAMGISNYAHDALNPVVGFFQVIPKIALLPLFVVLFGLRVETQIIMGFLFGVIPIILNTSAGVHETKREYIYLARSYGYSVFKTFRKVILPNSVGPILTGIFLGSNLVMVGVLVVQLAGGLLGLGYMILLYSNAFLPASLYATAILAVFVFLCVNGALWYLSRRLNSWRLQ